MTVQLPGDQTFYGIFASPGSAAGPPPGGRVPTPDLRVLCSMTVTELEALLVEMVADRQGKTRAELMAGPMLDGSPRTQSILMVTLMNQIAETVGRPIIGPKDLNDSRSLRSIGGAARVFHSALARVSGETE